MKQTHQSVAMAGLLAVALTISGCAGMRDAWPGGSSSSGSSGSSGASGSSGSSGTSTESIQNGAGVSGSSSTSSMQDDGGGSASTSGSAAPNSTVLAIETMPASGGISDGDASMGSSGAAGATGSADSGQPYRVTVRMDDGSTQVLTYAATPDFRSGDRVNVTNGTIQR